MTATATVVLLAALQSGPPPAPRVLGAIQGTVTVARPPAPTPIRPQAGDTALAAPPPQPDRTRTVIYLDPAPQGAFEEPERTVSVLDQRNEAFVPFVLAIRAGTEVAFPNRDRTYHNVFSLSKPKRFDLGRYAAGHSKSVRFDRPGVVRVFCDIHSHMSAFILVFAHRYYTVADADGRYRLDRVPSGTYNVVAWNDGKVREAREVQVPAGGAAQVDWVLP